MNAAARKSISIQEGPGPLTVKIVGKNMQCNITSDYHGRQGEWEDLYVDLSGFCGGYGPNMFASAPEMFDALDKITGPELFNIAVNNVECSPERMRELLGEIYETARLALNKAAKKRV